MRYTLKFILKTSGIAIVSGFIVGYSLFQAQHLMTGPTVDLDAAQNAVSPDGVADISGVAQNIAYLSFNGRQIYTDKNGNFSEKFALSDGYNIIKVSAQDKFGKVTDKTVELVYAKPHAGDEGGSLSMQTLHTTHGIRKTDN